MRSSLVWDVSRRRLVVLMDVSVNLIGPGVSVHLTDPTYLDCLALEDGTDTSS